MVIATNCSVSMLGGWNEFIDASDPIFEWYFSDEDALHTVGSAPETRTWLLKELAEKV